MLSCPLLSYVSMEFATTRERQVVATSVLIQHSKADVMPSASVLLFGVAEANDELHRVSIAYRGYVHKDGASGIIYNTTRE